MVGCMEAFIFKLVSSNSCSLASSSTGSSSRTGTVRVWNGKYAKDGVFSIGLPQRYREEC